MQAAFRECHGLQCGFCTPGMVMSAVDLLKNNPQASEDEIREGARRQHLPLHRLPEHRQVDPVLPVRRAGLGLTTAAPEPAMTDLSVPPLASPIGQPLRRREDQRFLTGSGQYTDDVVLHGQTHGAFVRSPHAHARIRAIDVEAARQAPGVVDVFTGADLADAKVGGLPCGWLIHSKDGTPMNEPPHPVLAHDKVRHVGDQVALVVAETRRCRRRTRPNWSRSTTRCCRR